MQRAFQEPLPSPRVVIRFLPAVENDVVKGSFAVVGFGFAANGLALNDVEFSFFPEKLWTEWEAFNVEPAPAKEPSQVVAISFSVADEERNFERVHVEIAGHAIGEAGIDFLFPDFSAHAQ